MEKGEGGGDLNFPPNNTKPAAIDYPATKKLARQLDFNSVGGGGSVSVGLPEHHQMQMQMQQTPSSTASLQLPLLAHPIQMMQQSHVSTAIQQPPVVKPV